MKRTEEVKERQIGRTQNQVMLLLHLHSFLTSTSPLLHASFPPSLRQANERRSSKGSLKATQLTAEQIDKRRKRAGEAEGKR